MLRFRLKTLMICFAAISVLLAMASAYLVPSYWERNRIAEITTVGAQVFTEPRGDFLFRQFAGDSLSERAVYVHLKGPQVTDEWLASLHGFDHIEHISINSPQVTDEGLLQLRELKKLRSLNLVNTKTTEEGAESLRSSLPQLQLVSRYDFVKGE